MKAKKHDLCAFFGCRRKTLTGRKEKSKDRRFCLYHSPTWIRERIEPFRELGKSKKKREPKIGRVQNLSLVCVYKEYELHRRDGKTRVVFTTGICGQPAPRRLTGDRSLPRYPSRFGDPLCEEHKHLGNDDHVFPPDPTYDGPTFVREDEEERQKHLERIQKDLVSKPRS